MLPSDVHTISRRALRAHAALSAWHALFRPNSAQKIRSACDDLIPQNLISDDTLILQKC